VLPPINKNNLSSTPSGSLRGSSSIATETSNDNSSAFQAKKNRKQSRKCALVKKEDVLPETETEQAINSVELHTPSFGSLLCSPVDSPIRTLPFSPSQVTLYCVIAFSSAYFLASIGDHQYQH
jgi:hypothetical protein